MAAGAAWCREALGLDYWQAWAIVLGFSALAGAWIRALDRRLAPGFARCGIGVVKHGEPAADLSRWRDVAVPAGRCKGKSIARRLCGQCSARIAVPAAPHPGLMQAAGRAARGGGQSPAAAPVLPRHGRYSRRPCGVQHRVALQLQGECRGCSALVSCAPACGAT